MSIFKGIGDFVEFIALAAGGIVGAIITLCVYVSVLILVVKFGIWFWHFLGAM